MGAGGGRPPPSRARVPPGSRAEGTRGPSRERRDIGAAQAPGAGAGGAEAAVGPGRAGPHNGGRGGPGRLGGGAGSGRAASQSPGPRREAVASPGSGPARPAAGAAATREKVPESPGWRKWKGRSRDPPGVSLLGLRGRSCVEGQALPGSGRLLLLGVCAVTEKVSRLQRVSGCVLPSESFRGVFVVCEKRGYQGVHSSLRECCPHFVFSLAWLMIRSADHAF